MTIKYQLTTTIFQKVETYPSIQKKKKKRHPYYNIKKEKRKRDRSEERMQKRVNKF